MCHLINGFANNWCIRSLSGMRSRAPERIGRRLLDDVLPVVGSDTATAADRHSIAHTINSAVIRHFGTSVSALRATAISSPTIQHWLH